MATEMTCPTRRTVPSMDVARLYWRFGTAPMMALLFGAANRAKPTPMTMTTGTTSQSDSRWTTATRPRMPRAVMAMPTVAMRVGEWRSESFPAVGESMAITMGWISITRPASREERPSTDCR